MSQLKVPRHSSRQCLSMSGVDWTTYSRMLRIFAERPGYRLTYDRGELEIMSPSLEHDSDGAFLGKLVDALTEELGLPLKSGGSVTLRRRLLRRGLEPDRCFWIANAQRMAGKRRLNLRVDPPSDLAIEVDVTHSSLDRMSVYAALRVPEVWRLKGDTLSFHVLREATYVVSATSPSFPFVAPKDLIVFLKQARQAGDEHEVVRRFRNWIQQRQKRDKP